MKASAKAPHLYIGWDVGGWNCDKNRKSRDAIVILDDKLKMVGRPWRGNLRKSINEAVTGREWVEALFAKCEAEFADAPLSLTIAIDTPLGFSDEFVALLTKRQNADQLGASRTNPYLYRQTERRLFENGYAPLSAIKDMIGSQATKGMHVLAKFAPEIESCGVWTDGLGFRALETYPTVARTTGVVRKYLRGRKPLDCDDEEDARICAVVAHHFANNRREVEEPPATVSMREGWIWLPGQAD